MFISQLQVQLWAAIRRAWLSIARAGAAAALGGFAFGELGGILFNGGHLTLFVHLVSFVLAIIAAYGAIVTVGIFQAVRGVVAAVADIESDLRTTMGGDHVIDAAPRG